MERPPRGFKTSCRLFYFLFIRRISKKSPFTCHYVHSNHHVYICVYMIWIAIYVYICMRVCAYIYTYTRVCVLVFIHTYVYMHMCIDMYVYEYIYAFHYFVIVLVVLMLYKQCCLFPIFCENMTWTWRNITLFGIRWLAICSVIWQAVEKFTSTSSIWHMQAWKKDIKIAILIYTYL